MYEIMPKLVSVILMFYIIICVTISGKRQKQICSGFPEKISYFKTLPFMINDLFNFILSYPGPLIKIYDFCRLYIKQKKLPLKKNNIYKILGKSFFTI